MVPLGQTAGEGMRRGGEKQNEGRRNKGAAANRRPAGQLSGSGNLLAIVAAGRAFPAAVAELSLGVARVWPTKYKVIP